MRKVLWLSNYRFVESPNASSGTWIEAMGRALACVGHYELHNITLGSVSESVESDACGIKQWIFPIKTVVKKALWELPPEKVLRGICDVVNAIKPDLVHVWGIERFWGLLTARNIIRFFINHHIITRWLCFNKMMKSHCFANLNYSFINMNNI